MSCNKQPIEVLGTIPTDLSERSAFYAQALRDGTMTQNQVRAVEGLGPLEDVPPAKVRFDKASSFESTYSNIQWRSIPRPDKTSGEVRRLVVPWSEWGVSLEKRAEGAPSIVGRAAVFYDGSPETEYWLLPDLVERITPRAFNKALNEKHDVRALWNHDPNYILGRTTAGTLRLSKSLRGLDYEVDPTDTTYAQDLMKNLQAGNVTGSSFGFRILEQKWRTEQGESGEPFDVREIVSVELFDVSPVTFPAYAGTSVGLRAHGSIDEAVSARDAWRTAERELRERLDGYEARAKSLA